MNNEETVLTKFFFHSVVIFTILDQKTGTIQGLDTVEITPKIVKYKYLTTSDDKNVVRIMLTICASITNLELYVRVLIIVFQIKLNIGICIDKRKINQHMVIINKTDSKYI